MTPELSFHLQVPILFAVGAIDMADDLNRRGPEDPNQINVNEPWEVKGWTKKWNITEQQLRDAVKAVGTSTSKVAAYLGKKWP